MHQDEVYNFNFWPAFSDLMLTILLVIISILFIYITKSLTHYHKLDEIEQTQWKIIEELKSEFNLPNDKVSKDTTSCVFRIGDNDSFFIDLSPDAQRFSFGGQILFKFAQDTLSVQGKSILWKIGEVIRKNQEKIEEIQIQGHTDTTNKTNITYEGFDFNLDLGAKRAMRVYMYMINESGFNPDEMFISATTYGKHVPTDRRKAEVKTWNRDSTNRANESKEKRDLNRRIELVLKFPSK